MYGYKKGKEILLIPSPRWRKFVASAFHAHTTNLINKHQHELHANTKNYIAL